MKPFFFSLAVLIWASYILGAQSIELVQESNGFRHLPSSVLFPLHHELTQRPMTFGEITRLRRDFGVEYTAQGTRPSFEDYMKLRRVVGMEYSHYTIPLEIILYVYPALRSFEDEFTYAVNEIYSALSPQIPHIKPRESVESSLEIRGYAQEFRYTEYFRSEKQVLVSTVEIYQHNGWFVKARMTVSHDYAPDGRRLVRELLDSLVWPQPIGALPITFSSYGTITYQDEDYRDGFFGNYLPLVRMLQEEPRLSAETVEALVQYEKQAQRAKRSLLLWGPVLVDVVPLAAMMYIAEVEGDDHQGWFKEWSTGSYVAFGVGGVSLLIGLGHLVYAIIADPGSPFSELGLVNRDLMVSR